MRPNILSCLKSTHRRSYILYHASGAINSAISTELVQVGQNGVDPGYTLFECVVICPCLRM